MNRPDPKDLNEILNRCITKLQNGQGLESILKEYPGYASQLRPILESVLVVWSSRGSDTIPMAAMQRSRKRFLNTAAEMKQSFALPWWRRPFSFNGGIVVPAMVLLVCAVLLFTGIASAKALPGQPFYPVKLAAEQISLSLPASPSNRLTKEENYDQRRQDEVEALLSEQSTQEVDLTGFLIRNDDGSWRIDKLKITVATGIQPEAEHLAGRYVTVHADLLGSGEVIAKTLEARIYTINGKINKVENGRAQVGDVWVEITPETGLTGALALGADAKVDIVRIVGDGYLAVHILQQSGSVAEEATRVVPSETPDTRLDATETEPGPESSLTPTKNPPTVTATDTQENPQVHDTPEPDHNPEPTQAPEIKDTQKPENGGTSKPTDSSEEHHKTSPTAGPSKPVVATSTPGQDGEHSGTQSPTKRPED